MTSHAVQLAPAQPPHHDSRPKPTTQLTFALEVDRRPRIPHREYVDMRLTVPETMAVHALIHFWWRLLHGTRVTPPAAMSEADRVLDSAAGKVATALSDTMRRGRL